MLHWPIWMWLLFGWSLVAVAVPFEREDWPAAALLERRMRAQGVTIPRLTTAAFRSDSHP
jgi:hypothetical protein